MAELYFNRNKEHRNIYLQIVIMIPPAYVLCIKDTNTDNLLKIGNIYRVDKIEMAQDFISVGKVYLKKDNNKNIYYNIKRFIFFPFSDN